MEYYHYDIILILYRQVVFVETGNKYKCHVNSIRVRKITKIRISALSQSPLVWDPPAVYPGIDKTMQNDSW